MTPRARVIGRIADHLVAQDVDHPLRVAVDGITAAGKTTLADELATAVGRLGRPVLHLSMDGFHHPRARRHRQGRDSAIGYYQDAYDVEGVARAVLVPLGPDGDRRYRTRIHDLGTDETVDEPPRTAASDLVLIVDGTFLQRRELVGLWDEVVFVDTSTEVARARGTVRDASQFGTATAAGEAYDRRYHAACRLYLDEVVPRDRASIVLTNDDVEAPVLHRIGGPVDATVTLFSYGTLQQPGVQQDQFGRTLTGRPDLLTGHRTDWVTITDPAVIASSGSARHPVVRPSGREEDTVAGTDFVLSTTELAAADRYEVEDYRRVRVGLASGAQSWLYRANPDAGPASA